MSTLRLHDWLKDTCTVILRAFNSYTLGLWLWNIGTELKLND